MTACIIVLKHWILRTVKIILVFIFKNVNVLKFIDVGKPAKTQNIHHLKFCIYLLVPFHSLPLSLWVIFEQNHLRQLNQQVIKLKQTKQNKTKHGNTKKHQQNLNMTILMTKREHVFIRSYYHIKIHISSTLGPWNQNALPHDMSRLRIFQVSNYAQQQDVNIR